VWDAGKKVVPRHHHFVSDEEPWWKNDHFAVSIVISVWWKEGGKFRVRDGRDTYNTAICRREVAWRLFTGTLSDMGLQQKRYELGRLFKTVAKMEAWYHT